MALTAGQTGHLADHQEGVYTVVHGATAGSTRPTLGSSGTSPTVVLWVGTVEPTNAVDNDLWMDTTSGSPNSKVKVSGSFVTAGSGTYAPASVFGPYSGFVSARYYPAILGARISAYGLANGTELACPFVVGSTETFDRIGINVTTAGATGSVIRLGIRQVDNDGLPGDLVLDAGTVDATSTGFKEITISQALDPGGYWLVAVGQGSPATNPQVTAGAPVGVWQIGHPGGSTAATTLFAAPSKTGTTGALSSGGSWTGINGNAPVVLLRAA